LNDQPNSVNEPTRMPCGPPSASFTSMKVLNRMPNAMVTSAA
jgi:hypothetical protein